MSKRFLRRGHIKVSFIETIVNVLGNTASIWLSYFLISIFFRDIIDTEWYGLNFFIHDGSLLIISFSFITSVLIATVNGWKLNVYNVSGITLFFLNAIIYARHIGKGGLSTVNADENNFHLWIPFLASIFLLFFAVANQKISLRRSKWLKKSKKNNSSEIAIFLSYAIAGNKNSTQRNKVKENVKKIENKLKSLGYSPIFNADNHIMEDGNYPPPAIAAKEDFEAIEESKNFLLFYPAKVPTSALIELGYALRDEDNILILTPKKEILPFLARDLNEISNKVKVVEFNDIDHILSILENSHESYFEKL